MLIGSKSSTRCEKMEWNYNQFTSYDHALMDTNKKSNMIIKS